MFTSVDTGLPSIAAGRYETVPLNTLERTVGLTQARPVYSLIGPEMVELRQSMYFDSLPGA